MCSPTIFTWKLQRSYVLLNGLLFLPGYSAANISAQFLPKYYSISRYLINDEISNRYFFQAGILIKIKYLSAMVITCISACPSSMWSYVYNRLQWRSKTRAISKSIDCRYHHVSLREVSLLTVIFFIV